MMVVASSKKRQGIKDLQEGERDQRQRVDGGAID
jgi:hypothetical protein